MFKAYASATAAAFDLLLDRFLGGQIYGTCRCQWEDQVVVSFDAALRDISPEGI